MTSKVILHRDIDGHIILEGFEVIFSTTSGLLVHRTVAEVTDEGVRFFTKNGKLGPLIGYPSGTVYILDKEIE